MTKKQFKTESKKLLDMMVNSIYTHKEIFLREIISNASDAIDKLYFRSLTDQSVGINRSDYRIDIMVDKKARTISVADNGCGMSKDELENNLGTIAKSGSFDFKNDGEKKDVDIIGQFGVGFYSAFMVADKIEVVSKAFGSDESWKWESEGADGYTVSPCEKENYGTIVTLHIKNDTEDEKYSEYLESYRIEELVKKYSDYIATPICMDVEEQKLQEGSTDKYETKIVNKVLNSRVPLWKKKASEITEEEFNDFYRDKFYDYEAQLKSIVQHSEGLSMFDAIMFIPSHAPFNYYSKDYEKGLQLYSNGVMIMDKCKDLLPDYFSFVKGSVDSADLSLNISREMLQHDRQLKIIAKAIENKIRGELNDMLEKDRETYEKFFKAFGTQLKFGIYSSYGITKDALQDLLLFKSSFEKKEVTFKEYLSRMKENQKEIFYACGETIDKISMLPQVAAVLNKGYEVLFLLEDVDEFTLKMMRDYDGKEFRNVCADSLDIASEEEKEQIKAENESAKDMLSFMKENLKDEVEGVRFTNSLADFAVCLTSEGDLSVEMEKVLNKMPNAEEKQKAQTILELNVNHPIAKKLRELYDTDKEKLSSYTKILYQEARLIGGMTVENPAELCKLVCDLMV